MIVLIQNTLAYLNDNKIIHLRLKRLILVCNIIINDITHLKCNPSVSASKLQPVLDTFPRITGEYFTALIIDIIIVKINHEALSTAVYTYQAHLSCITPMMLCLNQILMTHLSMTLSWAFL